MYLTINILDIAERLKSERNIINIYMFPNLTSIDMIICKIVIQGIIITRVTFCTQEKISRSYIDKRYRQYISKFLRIVEGNCHAIAYV